MTLKIDSCQRETLRELMGYRFFLGGERRMNRARERGAGHDQLGREFGQDMRLMEDLGWLDAELLVAQGLAVSEQAEVELRMPADELAATLRRAREDARVAL